MQMRWTGRIIGQTEGSKCVCTSVSTIHYCCRARTGYGPQEGTAGAAGHPDPPMTSFGSYRLQPGLVPASTYEYYWSSGVRDASESQDITIRDVGSSGNTGVDA